MDIAPSESRWKEMMLVTATTTSPSLHCPITEGASSTMNTALFGIQVLDGTVLWQKNVTNQLQNLNCSLIDINQDGLYDCLTYSLANGVLTALDSLTGTVYKKLFEVYFLFISFSTIIL